jgi:hypothetical protein
MRVMSIPAALAVVAALGGCGGGGAGGDGGAGSASCDGSCWHPTSADEDFAMSFCALTAPCCARNNVLPDAGVQSYADECESKILRAGFTRDAALRASCLADLQAATGSDACLPDYGDITSSCMRVFYEPSGPIAPGGSCKSSADCAGRSGALTICEHLSNSSVCLSAVPGSAGKRTCLGDVSGNGIISLSPFLAGSPQMQAFTGTYCATKAGLYCSFDNDPAKANVCTTFFADGAACLYPRTCASGSCVTADGSQDNGEHPGACGPTPPPGTLPAGAKCTGDGDCASGDCGNASTCLAISHGQRLAQLGLCTAF